MKTHKSYAFSEPEFHLNSGSIHAKLRGTMLNIDDVTSVSRGPYEMLLWFKLNAASDLDGCLVSLTGMTLKNTETDDLVPISKIVTATFRQKPDGGFIASINIKNLHLLYADHEMRFVYSFNDNCGLIEAPSSVSMVFVKDYSERKISFWDVLMGI
ncbi:MAG TPA: hypothetical protein ENJ13_10670 [Chromatiales bacterium]|nr:hypothetical protein [Chromatiales bacterium]